MSNKLPKWKIWLLAARPKTLWAGITPVVIGGALALDIGRFHLLSFFAALSGSILIQIGANFANDLFDFLKAADDENRLGPTRVTQTGLVTLQEMKTATIVVFVLSAFVGFYLVYRGGVPILIIGLTSILFAVLYTAGPYPLGYIGLGELFVLIYYGPVAVAGTFYVMALKLNWISVLAGIPPGMISAAILTVNNLRDADNDQRSGKKTLAVRFGKTFAKWEYLILMLGAILFPTALFFLNHSHPRVFLTGLALFPAIPEIKKVFTIRGAELNQVLAQTGKILALFGVLFSIGWLL